jgi:hypothetical protein
MIIRKYAGIFIMFASLAEEYGSTTCFVINRAHQNPISILSSKRSSSDSGQSNKQTKQHNKNLIKEANIYSNNKRMRKSEIDDLVRGIGLLPAQLQSKTNKMINQSNGKKQTHTKKIKDQYKDHTSVIVPRISLQEQLDYARNGHTVLRSFIPPQTIEKVESEIVSFATSHALVAWKQKVEVQLADSSYDYHRQNSQSIASSLESIEACQDMLESFGIETGDLPFLQYFNTWRAMDSDTPTIRQLCLSPYLAQAASILMDTPTVRLYQDSLFHKRAGDGWTPWHSDARMTPFDTSKMITFWIPLQNVPTPENGGTGLYFVNCSQSDVSCHVIYHFSSLSCHLCTHFLSIITFDSCHPVCSSILERRRR